MSLLIKGAQVVTQDRERRVLPADVLIEDGLIQAIGPELEGGDEVIEAQGDILIPGLINTHCHVAMSIMKGVADDVPFPTFLERVFAIDSDRQRKDLLAGARLGLLEMMLGGTTTFVDLYYSEDIIAQAVQEAGLRGVLCWAVLDQEFTTQKGVPLDNCKRFHSRFSNKDRIYPGIGLQGVYVCSTETLQAAEEFSSRTGALMHLHLSETRKEVHDHKKKTGLRPAEYLERIGVLSPRVLAAHAAWLTINEVRTLGRNGCSISTCPVSNMKLATGGVAPIPEMLSNGVNVTIGTDGSSTNNSLDMFGEMKTLALLQKASRWDPTVLPAQQVLDCVTINAARAIGLGEEIGSIEVGKKADLVLLDGHSPNLRPITTSNLINNIVYAGHCGNVRTVICDGKVVVRDRICHTMDHEKVVQESEPAILALMERR